jgi:hypothetical protein
VRGTLEKFEIWSQQIGHGPADMVQKADGKHKVIRHVSKTEPRKLIACLLSKSNDMHH